MVSTVQVLSLVFLMSAPWSFLNSANAQSSTENPNQPTKAAKSPKSNNTFVIALKPDKDPEALLKERKSLSEALAKVLKKPVEVIVPLSGSVIQEGLLNQSIDVAFISGMDLVKAEQNQSADLLLAVEIDGQTSYQSYWVTLKDKNYNSVLQLKNKPIAFASRTSTSGYLIPMWDLVQKKAIKPAQPPETFFGKGQVVFGTGYVSAIERVLAGDAEAAAVSDYVMDRDKHLNPEQKSKLKVMAKQGPVPTHVLAARRSLSVDDKDQLKRALLTLNDQPLLRDQVFTSKLVVTDSKKHIGGLKSALSSTGIRLE